MEVNYSSKSSTKMDRKTIEKYRRNQLKDLYSQLNSLVPHDSSSSSKGLMSLPDHIDQATNYIKKLQEDVENLKKKKETLVIGGVPESSRSNNNNNGMLKSPVRIELHENNNGRALEVILVTGLDCHFVFIEAIRILHEEHAEVLNATYSVDDNSIFHNIHAQIGEGVSVAQISERLNKFFAL